MLWRCDGENDCEDGSDEVQCHATECNAETQLRCDHGQCIPISWACDGASDCMDGTDERNCSSRSTCPSDKFQCKDGPCIDKRMVCDSRRDCVDGSDEVNCSKSSTCKGDHFACNDGITCIYTSEVCDGYKDCNNGEDEKNCSTNSEAECTDEEYLCSNTSRCIPKRWLCDGDDDCGDKGDEDLELCRVYKIPAVPSFVTGCEEFTCSVLKQCISWSKVCDGVHDCDDLTDEGPLCSRSCTGDNGGCSQKCQKTPQGSKCSCHNGYVLAQDGIACEDANECDIPGSCSQLCSNYKGGFKCSCEEGYVLEHNHRSCKADGKSALLVYLLPDQIRGIDLGGVLSGSLEFLFGNISSRMRGIDYDYSDRTVFVTDWEEKKIHYVKNSEHSGVLLKTPARPQYLRRDWITKNIYFTDEENNVICSRNDGEFYFTVVKHTAPHINGFDISPHTSLLFWSVWVTSAGGFGRIERAEMDGSNRKAIISQGTIWPSSVVVDHVLKNIYWVDTKLQVLECADFNGLKRRTVLDKGMHHPFSITVFEDFVYWSDWGTDSLNFCNKFSGQNCTTLHKGNAKSEVLMVEHTVVQRKGQNRCANSNCPHICLPTSTSFVCKCDDHYLPVQSHCELNSEALYHEPSNKSCPSDYCQNNAKCVIDHDRYFCICSSSYRGSRCQVRAASIQNGPDHSWVVGVVLAVLVVGLIVTLTFFCRNRDRLSKMGESVAVAFRNTRLSRKGSKLIEDCEDGTGDSLDLGTKTSKKSTFSNPLFGKKSQVLADPQSEGGFKRWTSNESLSESRAGSGFRVLEGPQKTTDRIVEFFRR